MRRWIVLAVWLAIVPTVAHAQVGIEVRGGAAIGNHTPAAAGLELLPGPSFSGTVLIGVADWLAVYGAGMRSGFGCEEGFCTDRDVDIVSGGWGGGVRLDPGIPWVQAGLLRLTTRVTGDGPAFTGPAQLAYEMGAGVSLPLGAGLRFVSGAFYRSSLDADERTTLVAGEVGLRIERRLW